MCKMYSPMRPDINFIYPIVCEYPLTSLIISILLLAVIIIILLSIGGEKK